MAELLPNFVIIGAPKCGTSSLYNWLSQHPDVCGAYKKETFFLMDAENPLAAPVNINTHGLSAYAGLFPLHAANAQIRMEATTHYLYQKVARETLAAFDDIKVCVVVREPAARVLSSFNYTQNNLARLSANLDFESFLALLERGQTLYPRYCTSEKSAYVLERDIEYSRYSTYLGAWANAMGPDRFKVIIFEEMIQNPGETLSSITDWLKLPRMTATELQMDASNRTVPIRNPILHRAVRGVSAPLRDRLPFIKKLKKAYFALQRSHNPRSANQLPRNLTDQLANESSAVAVIMGRSGRIWKV